MAMLNNQRLLFQYLGALPQGLEVPQGPQVSQPHPRPPRAPPPTPRHFGPVRLPRPPHPAAGPAMLPAAFHAHPVGFPTIGYLWIVPVA